MSRSLDEVDPEVAEALRDEVRSLTRRHTTSKTTEEVVGEINQVTRGWGNYFALAHCSRSFGTMNWFIAHRLRQWLWRKHGSRHAKYERWPTDALFREYGLRPLQTT